jgi:uncharacterized repeat protein (TIGR04138 family)
MIFLADAIKRRPAPAAHVSARQLCEFIRDLAAAQAGSVELGRAMLAETLGITHSEQIGALVFALVECGLLKAEAGDSPDDFDGVFESAGFWNTTDPSPP